MSIVSRPGSGLGDIGNPNAPVGSREWIQHLNIKLQIDLRENRTKVGLFRSSVVIFENERYFEKLVSSQGEHYRSFREYLTDDPPWGLGAENADAFAQLMSEMDAEQNLHNVVSLDQFRLVRKPEAVQAQAVEPNTHGGNRRSEEFQPSHEKVEIYGETQDYIASRIKRDRPDIAAKVEAGEFSSMRKAGIAAGIVKPKVSIMLGNPEQVAQRIYNHGEDFAIEVAEHLEVLITARKEDE